MEQYNLVNELDIKVPSLDGSNWLFEYKITVVSTQPVVVRWECPPMGSGEKKFKNGTPIWWAIIYTWRRCVQDAFNQADIWNEEDAKV